MLDVAMRSTGAVTAALTLTLAFCAVQARSHMTEAGRLVHAEAAAISSLARLAARVGAEGHAIPPVLRAYLRSIAEEEFHTMTAAGRHGATQDLAEALESAAYAAAALLPGSLSEDMLQEIDVVEAAREARLQAAAVRLPPEFWLLIILLSALIVATGALYPPRAHVVALLSIQAAGLGALVAFVFVLEQPFHGTLTVSPEPYLALHHGLTHRAGILHAPGAPDP
jgi:hypothetical protein